LKKFKYALYISENSYHLNLLEFLVDELLCNRVMLLNFNNILNSHLHTKKEIITYYIFPYYSRIYNAFY
jgi:hypothetical protein